LNISQYSPQSISQGRGDIEFSLSRIPTAQAPRLCKREKNSCFDMAGIRA